MTVYAHIVNDKLPYYVIKIISLKCYKIIYINKIKIMF